MTDIPKSIQDEYDNRNQDRMDRDEKRRLYGGEREKDDFEEEEKERAKEFHSGPMADAAKYLGINQGVFERVEDVGYIEIKTLIDKGWLDPESRQNDSPTASELLNFVEKYNIYSLVKFELYIVPDSREDARVTVEGICFEIHHPSYTADILEAIEREFKSADEYTKDPSSIRVWWD